MLTYYAHVNTLLTQVINNYANLLCTC